MTWPDRIIDLDPATKGQLMATDPDRYLAQVHAERAEQARDRVTAQLAANTAARHAAPPEPHHDTYRRAGPPLLAAAALLALAGGIAWLSWPLLTLAFVTGGWAAALLADPGEPT